MEMENFLLAKLAGKTIEAKQQPPLVSRPTQWRAAAVLIGTGPLEAVTMQAAAHYGSPLQPPLQPPLQRPTPYPLSLIRGGAPSQQNDIINPSTESIQIHCNFFRRPLTELPLAALASLIKTTQLPPREISLLFFSPRYTNHSQSWRTEKLISWPSTPSACWR